MRNALLIVLLLASAISIAGQDKEPSGQSPLKLDVWNSLMNCEDYLARMDEVLVNAHSRPGMRVFFIVYEGKTQERRYRKDGTFTVVSRLPQYGLARAKIKSMQSYLRQKGADINRFTFVSGGFREDFEVDIYLIPEGAVLTAFPTVEKMKYRKGKPKGYCLGCCGP